MERTASRLPVLDGSKSRETTYLEKVLMEMRSRFHKMGYILQDKAWNSGYLGCDHTIRNERTEVLADLMNLYFLAETLLLSLITHML